ncbi:hypothetical protein SASPL_104974 [Salvia splendens]|uniref:Pectinesterase inhibitor domain-containing protein n=1 Tax=Salvia splendens TaxID=180675 RepID=A0A8X9A9K1_SALSN|nr:hypothetical protein SASPL_104974 [Salvia splendens]
MIATMASLSSLLVLLLATSAYACPLNKICNDSKNPDFCYTLLKGHANENVQQIDQFVIDETFNVASSTSSQIQSLLSQTSDPKLKEVYGLCSKYYGAALASLSAAKDRLRSRYFRYVRSAASAVSGDAAAGREAFALAPSRPIPVVGFNAQFEDLANVFVAVSAKNPSYESDQESEGRSEPENQGESERRSEPDPVGHHSPPPKQMEQGPSANPNADAEIELSPILEVEPDDEVLPEKEDNTRRMTTNPSSSDCGAPPFNFPEINDDFERRTKLRHDLPVPPPQRPKGNGVCWLVVGNRRFGCREPDDKTFCYICKCLGLSWFIW